jgi:glutamine amidotransferase
MCELFAMSSRVPATVSLSLEEFAKHGGLTNHHKDGWGIAYYDDVDAQIIREPKPAFNSPHLKFVQSRGLVSKIVMSHIRKATLGELTLRNTQPFGKVLSGRVHTFVHNGMLREIGSVQALAKSPYQPIGETDSEYAFCILMERMSKLWERSNDSPSVEDRLNIVREFSDQLRPLGPANFIYSDSELVFGHGDKRTHEDGMRPPGLYSLHRQCLQEPVPVESGGLSITTEAETQDISLLASVPLTDEVWQPLRRGEIVVMQDGFVIEENRP